MVQAVIKDTRCADYPNVARTADCKESVPEKRFRLSEVALPVVATLAGSALLGAAMVYFWDAIQGAGNWAYLSVFIAEFGNSAAIMIPTPGPAYTIALSLILNPFALGIVGGIAATLGELVGYYVGRKGSRAIEGGRIHRRMESLATRWGGRALFGFAALPVPFDIAGLWAGTVRFPLWRFLLFVSAGKIVKITGLALVGAYGLTWILGPLA